MVKIRFGWAMPTFAGAYGAYFVVPRWTRIGYSSLERTTLLCESLGFDSIWLCDHVISGVADEIFECWTTLSALAAVTKRMRLGTLVLCNTFRHPAMMAKMAATLDVISGGRLDFGYGAGYTRENIHYGLPVVESAAQRIHMMEEGLEVISRMWAEKRPSYKGRYYEVKDAVCDPKPIQKPHPPVWIGGGGEKLLLRAVAKYADGWNWLGSVATMARKMEALRKLCEETGRRYEGIAKSLDTQLLIGKTQDELKEKLRKIEALNPGYALKGWGEPGEGVEAFGKGNLYGSPEEVSARIWEYADTGVGLLTLWFLDYPSTDDMELFAEKVMPLFS